MEYHKCKFLILLILYINFISLTASKRTQKQQGDQTLKSKIKSWTKICEKAVQKGEVNNDCFNELELCKINGHCLAVRIIEAYWSPPKSGECFLADKFHENGSSELSSVDECLAKIKNLTISCHSSPNYYREDLD